MKNIFSQKPFLRLPQGSPDNIRLAFQTVLLSLAAGLSAVGFLFMTNFLFTQSFVVFAGRSKSFFAPALFIGGMSGYFLAGLAALWIPLTPADRIVLAAVGMSACLGAIVRPPLDLQSWQNLPVSAIANPRPIVLRDLSQRRLRETVDYYPHNSFPVEIGDKLQGIVTRQRILESLVNKETPEIQKVVTCFPEQTVRDIGEKFIESPVNVLVVVDKENGAIRGIITLHDLIRAQAAIQH